MAFDEIRLPLRVAYGSSGGPQFLTEVVTIDGGFERRNQCWNQARRKFDARTGLATPADASVLAAFFQARAGRARGFRLKDWLDFTSAIDGTSAPTWNDQPIGIGDGILKTFQLSKTYGSGSVSALRVITKPVTGTVRLGVGSVEHTTGWSVDTTNGSVTFQTPPPNGATIQAGFEFDVPVRFDTDRLALHADDKNLVESEIPLIEVRTP